MPKEKTIRGYAVIMLNGDFVRAYRHKDFAASQVEWFNREAQWRVAKAVPCTIILNPKSNGKRKMPM